MESEENSGKWKEHLSKPKANKLPNAGGVVTPEQNHTLLNITDLNDINCLFVDCWLFVE